VGAFLTSAPYATQLQNILLQQGTNSRIAQSIPLVMSIVSKLCRENSFQNGLVDHGVLDALTVKLGEYMRQSQPRDQMVEDYPEPPQQIREVLVLLLEAMRSIVGTSKSRCSQLLFSPQMRSLFGERSNDISSDGIAKISVSTSMA
jgi:hypothetical protein